MSLLRSGIFIVAAQRTPFGALGGKISRLTCTDLAEHAARACLQASKLAPASIDSVIFGNCMQTNHDTFYLPRHTALRVGIPETASALTVNRMCGSGMQALISAVHEIEMAQSRVVLAGGSESMSTAPTLLHDVRFGVRDGSQIKISDMLWSVLTDAYIKSGMGITAENLAEKYDISREAADEYALRSQLLWQQAHSRNVFKRELVPVPVIGRKGASDVFDTDECPRETSSEMLAMLKPTFKKDGVVTAGNSSAISDGAATILVASEEAVRAFGSEPLARVVGYSIIGCDPNIMGIGPVMAIDKLMRAIDSKYRGVDVCNYCDLIEINEAFSVQYLAVEKALHLDRSKTNVHGGAIAMGHPLGATGSRILGSLAHRLCATRSPSQVKRALGSACIGGGQGIAVLLESV